MFKSHLSRTLSQTSYIIFLWIQEFIHVTLRIIDIPVLTISPRHPKVNITYTGDNEDITTRRVSVILYGVYFATARMFCSERCTHCYSWRATVTHCEGNYSEGNSESYETFCCLSSLFYHCSSLLHFTIIPYIAPYFITTTYPSLCYPQLVPFYHCSSLFRLTNPLCRSRFHYHKLSFFILFSACSLLSLLLFHSCF